MRLRMPLQKKTTTGKRCSTSGATVSVGVWPSTCPESPLSSGRNSVIPSATNWVSRLPVFLAPSKRGGIGPKFRGPNPARTRWLKKDRPEKIMTKKLVRLGSNFQLTNSIILFSNYPTADSFCLLEIERLQRGSIPVVCSFFVAR